MLASPAYRSLSCYAKATLIELHRLYRGDNNGDIFMSVRSMANRLNINKTTALKALHQLEDRGFIRAKQRGAFHLKAKHTTTWFLTEHEHAGQLPTKDFMKWRLSEKQNTVLRHHTNSLTTSDRGNENTPEKVPHGMTTSYRQSKNAAATVRRRHTQIVYQEGVRGTGTPTTSANP